ncbi:hypothetical protein D3C79_886810 [compost metagenome]
MQAARQAQQIAAFEHFPAVAQCLVLRLVAKHPVFEPGRIVTQQGKVRVIQRPFARRIDKHQVARDIQGEGIAVLAVRERTHTQNGFKRQRVVEQGDRRDRHRVGQVRKYMLGQLADVVGTQIQQLKRQQAVAPAGPGLQVHVGQRD